MPSQVSPNAEDCRQMSLLDTPLQEHMSGRTRYAAAMYFYQRGMISAECLEVYRICSRLDHENPKPFLGSLGLANEIETLETSVRKQAGASP
jgi:hypothetical protein